MDEYEVQIVETFRYSVRIEAVNAAAAQNTAFSLEWITPADEVTVIKQTARLEKVTEVEQ